MRKKRTKDEFIICAKKIHGEKYDYSLVEYHGDKIKIKIVCPEHGMFEQRPTNHISGKQGCPKCGQKKPITLRDFIKKANTIHKNKYDYSLAVYLNSKTKIKIKCHLHGVFHQTPNRHLLGDGCILCRKPLIDEFIEKAKLVHGDKYDYSLVEYKDAKTKIKIVCPEHGHFFQKINDHLYGNGCPICRESKGEKEIRFYLEKNKISFFDQHRFNDCRLKLPLPFDFYLPEHNMCIEFHGIQHYQEMKFFHKTKKDYELQCLKDKIKAQYCYDKKINFIVINYKENINNVLEKKLK
jgi:hypothetical protein